MLYAKKPSVFQPLPKYQLLLSLWRFVFSHLGLLFHMIVFLEMPKWWCNMWNRCRGTLSCFQSRLLWIDSFGNPRGRQLSLKSNKSFDQFCIWHLNQSANSENIEKSRKWSPVWRTGKIISKFWKGHYKIFLRFKKCWMNLQFGNSIRTRKWIFSLLTSLDLPLRRLQAKQIFI